MQTLIRVSGLSKLYGDLRAVDNLSFTVGSGEVYGFLGQNGAGKSTTIRMLLTLIEPDEGQIEIFGYPLASHRREILRELGAVVERPDVYRYLSGYENLSLFARMSGKRLARQRLMEQLEQVGLKDRAHSRVETYSQGMKQRLGLAIALVHNPRLIILDEPTNGLDPQGIADVRNLILHLSRHEGKTVFVSSHLLNEVEMIADRMLVLDRGRRMAEGSVRELLDPARTILELEVRNPDEVYAWLLGSAWSDCLQEMRQAKILLRLNRNSIPDLSRDLVNAGKDILGLQPRNSLEDYFLSLTTNNQHVDTFAN